MGGKVEGLVSAAPLSDVDSIEVKRLAAGKTITVAVRGVSFVLEVGAGTNAKGVAEAFEHVVRHAHVAALLEPAVPASAHTGQCGDVFSTQPVGTLALGLRQPQF